jgi:hypothetical protein
MREYLLDTRENPGVITQLYCFPNGWGASVVTRDGHDEAEFTVVKFQGRIWSSDEEVQMKLDIPYTVFEDSVEDALDAVKNYEERSDETPDEGQDLD